MRPIPLAVLEPNTAVLREASSIRAPRLGSVVVCDMAADVFGLADARAFHAAAPWCPICLVSELDGPADWAIRQAFEPRPGLFALLRSGMDDVCQDPDLARHAVLARRPCGPEEVAGYIRMRTGRSDLSATLEACFAAARSGVADSRAPHRSTMSRHLSAFQPLKAHDWTAIGGLAQSWCRRAWSVPSSVESVAGEIGMDPRTLRSRVRRYCGCSFREARARVGWEWIVEAALRVHGYVRPACAEGRWPEPELNPPLSTAACG